MNTDRSSFYILTQGCKVNQYESQAIREAWTSRGMHEKNGPEGAGIILINTCAVTERAVSDLKRHVRKLHRSHPGASLLIAGCAVQAFPELATLDGVGLAVSQEKKHLLTGYPTEEQSATPRTVHDNPIYPDLRISGYKRSRGVVKIQDGCSHGCTYCIIPTTRGRSVSRDPQAVLEEIERLFETGVHEISLCGINLRHFGRDLVPRTDLWELLERIEKHLGSRWRNRARIRLSSLEPSELTERGLHALGTSSLVCPHLHISLQSGSGHILRRMGRGHYSPNMVIDFVDRLKKIWPVFALGADIITGFPGEGPDHFQETLECIREMDLTYGHIFPYSKRPGTPAASFGDQVPHQQRTERAARIRDIISAKRRDFIRSLTPDTRIETIFEDGIKGMSQFYIPCILRQPGLVPTHDRTIHNVIPTGQSERGLLVDLAGKHGMGETP
ncbi:MiaB/RimO family radical SAM methylthiotransferase [Desulfoplanes sp.]